MISELEVGCSDRPNVLECNLASCLSLNFLWLKQNTVISLTIERRVGSNAVDRRVNDLILSQIFDVLFDTAKILLLRRLLIAYR